MIKQSGKGYAVYSESGKKLSKVYPTRKQAQKRLDQIHYFKSKR